MFLYFYCPKIQINMPYAVIQFRKNKPKIIFYDETEMNATCSNGSHVTHLISF